MRFRSGILVASVLAAAVLVPLARADRVDSRLNDVMPRVVERLKAQNHKNVGVLRFRVQDGAGKETFDSPLSGRLVDRVENLLVIHGGPDERTALGVIHKAGWFASKQGVSSWYSKPADRRKLFEAEYPLAWGTKTVKADVFLTGKVSLNRGRKQTTVTLEAFDRANPTVLRPWQPSPWAPTASSSAISASASS